MRKTAINYPNFLRWIEQDVPEQDVSEQVICSWRNNFQPFEDAKLESSTFMFLLFYYLGTFSINLSIISKRYAKKVFSCQL